MPDASPAPEISLVLPCRNMAAYAEPSLRAYRDQLETTGKPFEIIVVPNASTDGTTDLAKRLAAGDPRYVCVENPAGGWGLSVRMGLERARGAILCYTNVARTMPPEVPAMIALWEANRPCIAKKRRVARGAPHRSVGSWLYNLEGRILFGTRTRDMNGTPKVFGRDFYERVRLKENGDLLDLEVMAAAARLGVPVAELVVAGFPRIGGKTTTNLRSAVGMLAGAWRLRLFG